MVSPMQYESLSALDYFAALVAEDAGFPVLEAVVAVDQDDEPELDVQGVLSQVDMLADRLCRRVPGDAAPLQRLRLLNQYFFQELGFGGNVNDYYDRANSSLQAVLRTRRGIPLTLALVYIEIATQLGLQAQGVSFPGHFLVKLRMPMGEVVIDPFTGRSLDREELEERLLPYRQQRGLMGEEAVPLGLFLQPALGREMAARLLRNLKEIHRSTRDWSRLVAVARRLVILLPDDWEERRDLGLALAQLGQPADAADALALYLEHRPRAADAASMRRKLSAWRRTH